MSELELASYPRDEAATMAKDWQWVLHVLRMMQDQALDGVPLRLKRPWWVSPEADVIEVYRNLVTGMITDIFEGAVVDEPREE